MLGARNWHAYPTHPNSRGPDARKRSVMTDRGGSREGTGYAEIAG
jgi:hypothetical protein